MTQLSTSRYLKRALLGEGGMGRVSLAYDTLEGREVALKEILDVGAGTTGFGQEFWWMSRLKHPHLVEVFDFGSDDDGRPFFTMEVVAGRSLNTCLPLPADRVRDVVRQLCDVLRHIHHQGLVHGDIKAANIRLLPDGALKLMDFGLMTSAGQVATVSGTLAYMAPEVIQRSRVDRRADLYAVGVLTYQLLTGRLPFEETTAAAMLRAHLEEPARPPSRLMPGLDPQWDRLVLRLLAKEPTRRFQSAAEVLAALGEPVRDQEAALLCSPFVGRERELDIFEQSLTDLRGERRGRTFWLSGPSGVGKTRLIEEFALRAQLAGVTVFRGAAGQVAGTPYEPFTQILRQAWPEVLRLDVQALEVHGPSLQTLIPDLVPASAAHRLEPQQEKLRLQAAIADLLVTLASRQGLVILVDHWSAAADPLGADLLSVLQRQFVGQPVVLVMASNEPTFVTEPVDAVPMALTALDRIELGRLVGAMLGVEAPPGAFVDQVAELTGGLPFATEAFIEHLVASGKLLQRDGHWVLAPLAPDLLPASVHQMLGDRLSHLPPLGRQILEVAAVIGREFSLAQLLRLLPEVPTESLFQALVLLEHGHLLVHREGTFRAAQTHLTEVLAHGLDPKALAALHTRVAEMLEEVVRDEPTRFHNPLTGRNGRGHPGQGRAIEEPPRPDGLIVRLAHHFLEGQAPLLDQASAESVGPTAPVDGRTVGALIKAIHYALKAAQCTAALFANDQARDFLTRGLALIDTPHGRAGLPTDHWLVEYLALLGDLSRVAGEFQEADSCYERGLPLAEAQGRDDLVAHLQVGRGLVQQIISQYETALGYFKLALPIARRLPNARTELRCLAAMGRAYYYEGDLSRSQAIYEEALMRARTVGDLAYAGESLGFLGLLHVSAEPLPGAVSRVAEGMECLGQAIAIKEAVGDKLGLNDSYMLLGNAQLALGDLAGAEHSFFRNQSICREIGAFEEVFAFLNLGLVAIERGDLLAALDRVGKATELAEPLENHFALGLAACLEARALLYLGMLQRPLAMLEASLARARDFEDHYWELFALVYLVEAHLHLGRWDDAEAALLEALNAQAASGVTEFNLLLLRDKAVLGMRNGAYNTAESAFREALARAEGKEAQLSEAHICFGLAELAILTGALTEGTRWINRAQDCSGMADSLSLLARCHHLRGRIAMIGGDFIEADSHFQRAQDGAVQLNLLDLMARVWYDRGVLQFPSPQSVKLLKRAQEVMVQQVEGLDPAGQEIFLAAMGRDAIFNRELPGEGLTAVDAAVGDARLLSDRGGHDDLEAASDHEARAQLVQARQIISQQRVWLDELQLATGLLLKQLDFAQALGRTQDAQHVLNQALSLVLEIAQAERGEVFMLEGSRLVPRARKQLTSLQPIDDDWIYYVDFLQDVVATGEMRYIPNTTSLGGSLGAHFPRTVLVLPLTDERDRLGVLLVLGQPEESGRLMKRELDALRVLASQLSSALKNIRLQSEWREKTQRLEMLYTLSSTVTSTLVMEEVLDLVLKLSLEITQAERGLIFLLDPAGDLECQAARHSLGPIANPANGEMFSQSICRRVLETGEAVCVEDTQDDDLLRNQKSIQDLSLRTVMCVPLRVQQKYLGVLYVDSRLVVNTFTGRDLELLKSIASHASIALENARLYNLATVDGLTQLYFRSHFEQRLREELNRAQRYSNSLCVMMMDIDHFKRFNDSYGHAVGDQVLRHVAAIIKSGVRQDVDIPARYGGEEMVVLLPETDVAGASIFAERIRKAVDETPLAADGYTNLHVTISIGIATYPIHAGTGLELMEAADRALYASKDAGRNCVTLYTDSLGR